MEPRGDVMLHIIMVSNLIHEAISFIYYIHVHLYLEIATSQAFDCSDKYVQITLLWKCTVAAAGNLSVQILYSIGNIIVNFYEVTSHYIVYRPNEALFVLLRWLGTTHVWLHHKN